LKNIKKLPEKAVSTEPLKRRQICQVEIKQDHKAKVRKQEDRLVFAAAAKSLVMQALDMAAPDTDAGVSGADTRAADAGRHLVLKSAFSLCRKCGT
jgi:hypothetical protein